MKVRLMVICIAAIALAAMFTFTTTAQEQYQSHVGTVLAKLTKGTWQFEGESRHGGQTKQESTYEKGPGGYSYLGKGAVSVSGKEVSSSTAVFTYHPKRGRWIYTGVSSSGAVQEAEELESGEDYFVFKGTAYRMDGGQTTFVWKVTILDGNRFRSESMAYHGGSWKDNPAGEYTRSGQ